MSKPKLTKRQSSRIAKIHQASLKKGEAVDGNAEAFLENSELGQEEQGLIIANYGQQADVEALDGQIYECYCRQNLEKLVSGDRVVWRRDNQQSGVITAILPRQTMLTRPDRKGLTKTIAANITQVVIVFSPEPEPTETLIDCYLAAAELQGFKAVIVLNKADLMQSSAYPRIEHLLQIYQQIGYAVIATSPQQGIGLDRLQKILTNQTSIFVGQSGVGKSSLISTLIPQQSIRIGAISNKANVGKHTTSHTQLYHFPHGGNLIDSPGVRNFQLWKVTPEQLLLGFKEFKPYLGQCKYRDCRHHSEPECALLLAVKNGNITQQRLQNYFAIVKMNER